MSVYRCAALGAAEDERLTEAGAAEAIATKLRTAEAR